MLTLLPVAAGKVRVVWKKPTHKWNAGEVPPEPAEFDSLRSDDPRFWQAFVPGMDAVLTKNLTGGGGAATLRGVSNGSRVTLAGIAYADPIKQLELQQKQASAEPGTTIVMDSPPDVVLVDVGRIDDAPMNLPRSDGGGILLALKLECTDKKGSITFLHEGVLKHVSMKQFNYDLTFCVTFHKLQGMTLLRLLLDLEEPVYPPHHIFESILVAASRIKEGVLYCIRNLHLSPHAPPLSRPVLARLARLSFRASLAENGR